MSQFMDMIRLPNFGLGVKTGNYTSGTVEVRIGEEDREQH